MPLMNITLKATLKTISAFFILLIISCNDRNNVQKKESISIFKTLDHPTVKRLVYLDPACECPDWSDYGYLYDVYSNDRDSNLYDNDYTFYIEHTRSDSNVYKYKGLKSFDVVEFICEEDSVLRLPNYREFDNNPPKWKVLMYSNYKIVGKLSGGKFIPRSS